jgi:hypothetical protein
VLAALEPVPKRLDGRAHIADDRHVANERIVSMSRLKIESARRQLGTALALYLEDRDPVSVHCLAGGGCELIEYYAKKKGGQPFTTHILQTHPDLDIEKVRKLQRGLWNAFKHATHGRKGKERDDDKALMRFSDKQNDAALFIGWYDYAIAVGAMPIEAQVHQAWFIAMHPEKLDPKHPFEPFHELFPNMQARSRAEQKWMLNEVIEHFRGDHEVMSDPRTDTRALVLGWRPK